MVTHMLRALPAAEPQPEPGLAANDDVYGSKDPAPLVATTAGTCGNEDEGAGGIASATTHDHYWLDGYAGI